MLLNTKSSAYVEFGSKLGWTLAAGPVAQWITRLTTDQKIPGSNPGKVDFFEEDGNIFC